MRLFNKKIIVFLITIALCNSAMFANSVQPTTDRSTKPPFDNSASLGSKQPNIAVGPHNNLGSGELFFKMMLMVLLVVALGTATVYMSKKFLPRFARLPTKRIKVVETVHLGPRKTVHLLKIDNRLLLIGSTNENMTKLSEIADKPSEAALTSTQADNIQGLQ